MAAISEEDGIEDICEQCQGEATVYCQSCRNSYCTSCNLIRHRVGKRKDHSFLRISTAGNVITSQPEEPEEHLSQPEQEDHGEAHLLGLLAKLFGRPSFKPWQKAIISATLEGKNTLVVQSTGAGKSLCFQFPCVATKTLTVVLMPTISLIKDQYHHLEGTGPRTTFLGSLQTDKSILSRIAQMEYDLVLCTPESFYDSVGTPKPVFKTLALQRKIGLIAIDEAHLVSSWNSFRPAYGFVKRLSKQFPGVPLMALTATATPHILADLKLLLGGNPVCDISSVNKANITYHVKEIKPQGGVDKYTNLASQLTPLLTDSKAIVYVDFIQDVSPLAISLRQAGIKSCSYHGDKMTAHDKVMALESWTRGEAQVMVCTSAFGMGIDQPDIGRVIRVGVPPSLEQCVQEFGRAGRDGRQCEGIIFYHENDLQHAKFWCEGENPDRQLQILTEFQASWRFVYSHVAGRCRRRVILDHFEDLDREAGSTGDCCDVCISTKEDECEAEAEMMIIAETARNLPGLGEVKLAEHIRGSEKTSAQSHASTHSSGARIGLSKEGWRVRIRQAWLTGLLERSMRLGKGHNLLGKIAFNTFQLSDQGQSYLLSPHSITLPPASTLTRISAAKQNSDSKSLPKSRAGKGKKMVTTIRNLMRDSKNWFEIADESDYHFPGVLKTRHPKRLGYCPDISTLPQYDSHNPHFLFTDIQLGKGKSRNPQRVSMTVDGKDETVWYRIVPCGGVKQCPGLSIAILQNCYNPLIYLLESVYDVYSGVDNRKEYNLIVPPPFCCSKAHDKLHCIYTIVL